MPSRVLPIPDIFLSFPDTGVDSNGPDTVPATMPHGTYGTSIDFGIGKFSNGPTLVVGQRREILGVQSEVDLCRVPVLCVARRAVC